VFLFDLDGVVADRLILPRVTPMLTRGIAVE
jgi:hypothetical protein